MKKMKITNRGTAARDSVLCHSGAQPLFILLFFYSFILSSCGELFDFDEPEVITPATLTLDRDKMSIMEGESFVMMADVKPDNAVNVAVSWTSSDEEVVRFEDGNRLVAVAPGTCTVTATSIAIGLKQTVEVTVVERWQLWRYEFARDMVVYADVTVNGRKMDESLLVGAFCDDELRGLGELRHEGSKDYVFFRIWSPIVYGDDIPKNYDPDKADDQQELDDDSDPGETPVVEVITFRCYDRTTANFYDFDPKKYRIFFDGETHGTLSDLFKLTFDNK